MDKFPRQELRIIYREHQTRKHGRRPDRFLAIRYYSQGKRTLEALGWESEGWTADMAQALVAEIKMNVKLGSGPQSLAEKRAAREEMEIGRAHV